MPHKDAWFDAFERRLAESDWLDTGDEEAYDEASEAARADAIEALLDRADQLKEKE